MLSENISTAAQIARFGVSGGLSTLAYGAIAIALTYWTAWTPLEVHLTAYAACIPVSYTLQRNFTFRHRGRRRESFPKFIVALILTFLVGTLLVKAVEILGWRQYIGTVCVMVAAPITGYLAMRWWAFRQ